jgi:hypothetical protein
MSAYIVLLFAILSRILPPALHLTAMNFTAVGGSLLFFGARSGRSARGTKRSSWQTAIAVLALMATDVYLTTFAYHYPFHVRGYLVTWAWYAGVCLLGHSLLQRATALRVTGAVLASATSFFILSNFVVWMGGMYAHTAAGLATCYAAALPFYRNDLVSTGLVAGALFGLPALATRLVDAFQPHHDIA